MHQGLSTGGAVRTLFAALIVSSSSPVGAAPTPGDLVINEIMQNPAAVSDSNGEWFEIANVSDTAIDINGWTIRDLGSDTHRIDNGGPLQVPAGGFVVLGIDSDPATNGGVSVDYQYSSFFLSNGDDEVILSGPGGTDFDQVAYDGGPSFPDPKGASMSLDPSNANTTDNDKGANWCAATPEFGSGDLGTPGAGNDACGSAGEPVMARIHAIQGSGPGVAISGPVRVEDVMVTALFEDGDLLDGFFVQERDVNTDGDPTTSEGIFVFCRSNCPADLAVGDAVTLEGDATEFFGMSQIDVSSDDGLIAILSSRNPLPTPTPLKLPASGSTAGEDTFEGVEGMIVEFRDKLVVSEYFQLARFGQVVLALDERPFQFTHQNAPSVAGYAAFLEELARRRIILDDDNNDQNDAIEGLAADEPYYYPAGGLSIVNRFRGGDTIRYLTGVMHWSWAGAGGTDAWRVRPLPEHYDYSFVPANPQPAVPGPVGGSLRVASFNVLNYFTTIDEGGNLCGPSSLDCRGAHSQEELIRQREKIVEALAVIDADIVGLIELENNEDAALTDLVDALNAQLGAGTYAFIGTGAIGGDAIKVGLIYKPATVAPAGPFAILDSSVDPTFIDTKNRPVLIQTFDEKASRERLTVAVNHLKSKGSPCDDVGDPDLGDGQANCNLTRTDAAAALASYLLTDPTGSGDPDFLILGDLNAYAMEDPITILTGAGYTDLVKAFGGAQAYSFLFDGQLGYLDHALASSSLLDQVTGVTKWHVNADEVPLFDYNDDFQTGNEQSFERESAALPTYEPNALRSSDHDPLIVGLALGVSGPSCNGFAATHVGTDGPDRIWGTSGRDVIVAFDGADTIIARGGDDIICAGAGNDRVIAGRGADLVFGENGDDLLYGSGGEDALDGGDGTDFANGGSGEDACRNAEVVRRCEG